MSTDETDVHMTDDPLDELGPIDLVIIEFPAGESNFTGEVADELVALVEAGTVRLIDVLILMKDGDGGIEVMELSDLENFGPSRPSRPSWPSSWPKKTSSTSLPR